MTLNSKSCHDATSAIFYVNVFVVRFMHKIERIFMMPIYLHATLSPLVDPVTKIRYNDNISISVCVHFVLGPLPAYRSIILRDIFMPSFLFAFEHEHNWNPYDMVTWGLVCWLTDIINYIAHVWSNVKPIWLNLCSKQWQGWLFTLKIESCLEFKFVVTDFIISVTTTLA